MNRYKSLRVCWIFSKANYSKQAITRIRSACLAVFSVSMAMTAAHAEKVLRLSTTTSTDNSGLLAVLNPPFEKEYGARIDVIAVGTGKALKLASNGDVDIVFVHAPAAEQNFVDQGFGIDRRKVMHNYFVIVGPNNDPAGLRTVGSAVKAFRNIYSTESLFVSRGDDSGTHKKEKEIWRLLNLDPNGQWYLSAGQGMGAVLKIADEKRAYTLTDQGTYLAFQDKIALVSLSSVSPELYNPYHVIAVNPRRFPHVNYGLAKSYIRYLTAGAGQQIIAGHKKAGQQLFFPDHSVGPKEIVH